MSKFIWERNIDIFDRIEITKNVMKVEKDVVYDILKLLVKNEEIEDREYIVKEWNESCFGCSSEDIRSFNDCLNVIYIPRDLLNKSIEEMESSKYFIKYLENYGFNYRKIMILKDLDFHQIYAMMGILHEIGHIIDGDKQIKKYGWLKRLKKEKEEDYLNISKYYGDEYYFMYREIPSERNADKKAVILFNRYAEEIIDIVKRIKVEEIKN